MLPNNGNHLRIASPLTKKETVTRLLEEEIVAIVPFFENQILYCTIHFLSGHLIVKEKSKTVIDFLLGSLGLTYRAFKKMTAEFTFCGSYCQAIATTNYSLFPLTDSTNKETIWVNSRQITAVQLNDFQTQLVFSNGLIIQSPKKAAAIRNAIVKSLNTLTLIKYAQNIFTAPFFTESYDLAHYLQLPEQALAYEVVNQLFLQITGEHVVTLQRLIVDYRIRQLYNVS